MKLTRRWLSANREMEVLKQLVGKSQDELVRDGTLWLASKNLTHLPPSVYALTHLKKMNLSYNRLTELSENIEELKLLERIFLFNNSLKQIPDGLGKLPLLVRLDLQNNNLEEISPEIKGLKSLVQLDLRSNRLKQLPSEIVELVSLEELFLCSNLLESLPQEFETLPSLRVLSLSSNAFEGVWPKAISSLCCLQELSISLNKLLDIPSAILCHSSLAILDASDNQIHEIPNVCSKLVSMNLSRNQIEKVGKQFCFSQSLQSLNLSYNKMTSLPLEFGMLSSLKSFNLSENPLKFSDEPSLLAPRLRKEATLVHLCGISLRTHGIFPDESSLQKLPTSIQDYFIPPAPELPSFSVPPALPSNKTSSTCLSHPSLSYFSSSSRTYFAPTVAPSRSSPSPPMDTVTMRVDKPRQITQDDLESFADEEDQELMLDSEEDAFVAHRKSTLMHVKQRESKENSMFVSLSTLMGGSPDYVRNQQMRPQSARGDNLSKKLQKTSKRSSLDESVGLSETFGAEKVLTSRSSLDSSEQKWSFFSPSRSTPPKSSVFGKTIEQLQKEGPLVPLILMECISFLTKDNRIKTEGLFRVSPNYRELQELKVLYDDPASMVNLEKQTTNPHNVAALMKAWLGQLGDPIFSFDLYQPMLDLFRSAESEESCINFFQKIIRRIPQERSCLIMMLFEFFDILTKHEKYNKMSAHNVGIVFGPNILRPRDLDPSLLINTEPARLVETLVIHYHQIFSHLGDNSPDLASE